MKVFGVAGWSGSGKTTLVEKLIPEFARRGVSVSVIKHAHKGFAIDQEGKDSQRFRAAGANAVMLSGARRWVLVHDLLGEPEPELDECLARLSDCDLVLVEGFKRQPIPKIEIHRAAFGRPLMAPDNPDIVAIAADTPVETRLPVLDLNDPGPIVLFIMDRVALEARPPIVR